MWIEEVILMYLCILGILDLYKRRVPVLLLGMGGVLLMGLRIWQCVADAFSWAEMIAGILPGFFMMLIAGFTKKAGLADGIVLIQLGACLGFQKVLLLFSFSLFLISVVSVILLIIRKVRKETKMPYLSFLAITFLIGSLVGG